MWWPLPASAPPEPATPVPPLSPPPPLWLTLPSTTPVYHRLMLRSTFLRAADGSAAVPTLDAGRMAVALAFYPAIDRALALYLTLDHGLPHLSASPPAEPSPPPPPPPTPPFASVVTRHMRLLTTSCKLIIAMLLACNFAGDLRAAREEETGRGICPSSLFNSASLVNSPPNSRRFNPYRSYDGRPPLYFPSAAARLATVPPILPGPTRPAIRRPTPRAPPPPHLPSRIAPAPSAVPFTSAVASGFQCSLQNRTSLVPSAPGLLCLADAAIKHRLITSAPPPPPPPTPSFASVVTRHMRFVTTSCKLIIATMLACNFAGDLRAAREEETGRGICPSSLFNSASLVNSPSSSRRFSPWRSYDGRPPLYFPSAAAQLATIPPILPGPTRPAIRRPTPHAPPPPRLSSHTAPAPSAVPFTSAVASGFQCNLQETLSLISPGAPGSRAPGLLCLADAAIRHRLITSAPPPAPTADQRRATMLSLADEVLRLSSSGLRARLTSSVG